MAHNNHTNTCSCSCDTPQRQERYGTRAHSGCTNHDEEVEGGGEADEVFFVLVNVGCEDHLVRLQYALLQLKLGSADVGASGGFFWYDVTGLRCVEIRNASTDASAAFTCYASARIFFAFTWYCFGGWHKHGVFLATPLLAGLVIVGCASRCCFAFDLPPSFAS